METKTKFTKDILKLKDPKSVADKLIEKMRHDVFHVLQRKGGVVGVSGGIDSSTCLALAVSAFGADNVVAIMLPEKDSSGESARLATKLCEKFGVKNLFTENITGALDGFGCYRRRDEAVARAIPSYNPATDKMKIVIKKKSTSDTLPPVHSVVVIEKDGTEKSKLLSPRDYLQIVAASNFKQRSRMSMLYYYAEAYHYAVVGTPNKHETEQGFFVKYGDGGADIMPIGNLYKTQVFQLAAYLGVPKEIIDRTPTTDTYTAEQTQEEFFYQLPFEQMDLLWFAYENQYNINEVAEAMNMSEEEVIRAFANFERRRKTTDYLRMSPIREY